MKSEQVPAVILKLSELMRYILSSSKENKVDLVQENEFLQNYLYLQKFRFTQNQNIQYNIEGDLTGKKIAPMLLIPFVENSFKHGVRAVTDQFYIHINLIVSGYDLTFTVANSKPKQAESQHADSIQLGLNNVKRRLDLLYPGRHSLEICDNPDHYTVMLRIQL
jgi:LytS/YehU family sensor histidine kinase